ncbi:MAG: hypothetical protein DRP00_05245 [Candidatus Aenigmatarchaeota archaeon]|nr:MAG: hypothetical protein DRP00_05245 [Candidatus Aenigmarchaeota archaeon]
MSKRETSLIFFLLSLSVVAQGIIPPTYAYEIDTPLPTVPLPINPTPYSGNPVLTYADVTDIDAKFVADPFIVKWNGTYYMFFELLPTSGYGVIGLSTSTDGFNWTYQGVVLDENAKSWHLSFPYVFRHNNTWYMIPSIVDNANNQGVFAIYTTTDEQFPYGWTLVEEVFRDYYVNDGMLFKKDGRWWFIYTNKACAGGDLIVKYTDVGVDLVGATWYDHPKNPVVTNRPEAGRGAGYTLVFENGTVLTFYQDGVENYGDKVKAYLVNISTTDYSDSYLKTVAQESGSGWNADGMHQYSALLDLENYRWLIGVDGYNSATGKWSIGIYYQPIPIEEVYPEIVNITPDPSKKIITKIYSEILFAVNFSIVVNCSWYLDGELLKSETTQNASITINFTSERVHKVTLIYTNNTTNNTIEWTVEVYKPRPSFTLKLQKHLCMVTESVGLQINITNLHELYDYEIRIDIGDDGVIDIITKDLNISLPSFTRPDRYKVAVYIVDPVTGAFNKTEAYLQVFAYKLFRGLNIMNTTGAVIYAESAEPVHAVIKPIKVTQNFTVIVSEENIFTNETGDVILNVTFVGLAGGDKVWLNETVVNARTVDLLHNGEPLLLAIPVENRSVNLTLTSFSTYTLVVNNTVAPMREQPPPEKEAFTIEEVLVLIGVIILLIAIIAGIHYISKKAKVETLARMESEFKFFRRLK